MSAVFSATRGRGCGRLERLSPPGPTAVRLQISMIPASCDEAVHVDLAIPLWLASCSEHS